MWYRLGSAYLDSAKVQTDPAEKTKRNTEAYNDLQKAVDLKKNPPQGTQAKAQSNPAIDNAKLAAYYDNLGAASARLGKVDEAANDYKQAAQVDPAGAADYYFNLGAILTNRPPMPDGKKQPQRRSTRPFTADPEQSRCLLLEGSNLGRIGHYGKHRQNESLPDGTAEAFQNISELKPTGPHAERQSRCSPPLGAPSRPLTGQKGNQEEVEWLAP